jgi:hypothetical protein
MTKTQQEIAEELDLGCIGCLNHGRIAYRGFLIDACYDERHIEDMLIEDIKDPNCGYYRFDPDEASYKAIADYIEAQEWERVGQ